MTASAVATAPRSRTSLRFRVEGMDCASCAAKIETAVRRIRPGQIEGKLKANPSYRL